jgi:hypothetical protein
MLISRGLSPYKVGAKVIFDLDSDRTIGTANGTQPSGWNEGVGGAMTKQTANWPTMNSIGSIAKLNGHKTMNFASEIVTRTSFAMPSKWTLFLVGYRNNSSSNLWFIEQGPDANSNNGMYMWEGGNGIIASRQTGGLRYAIQTGAPWVGSAATWYTRTVINDQGTTQSARRNGSAVTPSSTSGSFGAAQTVTDTLYIGGRASGVLLTAGRFVRLLIFEGALTTAQCEQVERYLQRLYRHY